MSTYDWLLFLHVLGAFALITMSLTVHGLYLVATRQRRPSDVGRFLRPVQLVGPNIGTAGLVTLAFGIWLVVDVGYDWGEAWIVVSLVLFAIGLAAGSFLGKALAPAGMLAGRLASQGDRPSEELSRLLRSPRVVALALVTALARQSGPTTGTGSSSSTCSERSHF
jgi:uncharacterized membrane protein